MRIDSSEVRRLQIDLANAPAEIRAKAPLAVKKTLFDIESTAKVYAPVDFGTLENSISTDVDADQLGGEVGPTVDYGAAVEYGAAPHVIRPKNPGGRLVFMGSDGQLVFATEVNHPGTPPQPYMGPAFDRHAPGLARALADAGEDIL